MNIRHVSETSIAATERRRSKAPADWWRGAVFYEVYVRSFRDTTGSGTGDLAGVLEKLDHIADLGVDAVWLSPFYRSPQKDFGYDITDFRLVDPSAGTMEDFLRLRDAVHARGMKLIIDFIPAHTSDEHPWFAESRSSRDNPKADWYVWADKAPDGTPPNNWLSSFGGSAWEWDPRRRQYYYHPFLADQPALNLHNPEVMEQLEAQMQYWLDHGVDGFRLDAVQCLTWDRDLRANPPAGAPDRRVLVGGGPGNPFADQLHLFDRNAEGMAAVLRRFRKVAEENGAVLIGELADVDATTEAADFTGGGDKLHAVYDFDLINCEAQVDTLTTMLKDRECHIGDGWRLNVFTNHDSTRAVSNLTGFAAPELREQAAKMLIFLQLSLRGGAILYQGEELGLPHPELSYDEIVDPWAKAFWPVFAGRDGGRTPMPWSAGPKAGFTAGTPWLPVPEAHRPLNVAAQRKDPDSVLNFAAAFIRWRREAEVLRLGESRMAEGEQAPIIAWHRRLGDADWLAIINFSEDETFMSLDPGAKLLDAPGCVSRRSRHGIHLAPFEFALAALR